MYVTGEAMFLWLVAIEALWLMAVLAMFVADHHRTRSARVHPNPIPVTRSFAPAGSATPREATTGAAVLVSSGRSTS